MNKPVDKKDLIKTMKELDKEFGDGTIFTLGGNNENMNIERWSTGIEKLDWLSGGGFPKGRVIHIWGPPSAGKTTLLYHLMAQHAKAVDIPIEGTFDKENAMVHGNKKGQLIVARARYGEEAMTAIRKFAEVGIPIIGLDSVPSMIPKKDYFNDDYEKDPRIGGIARLLNSGLPRIEAILERTGTTLIFINQVRAKMNATLFGKKTDTPGGFKLKHATSLGLDVSRRDWIKIPNYNPDSSASDEKVGMIMKIRCEKSKICPPYREIQIPLFFHCGFVNDEDVARIRKELMKARREQYK